MEESDDDEEEVKHDKGVDEEDEEDAEINVKVVIVFTSIGCLNSWSCRLRAEPTRRERFIVFQWHFGIQFIGGISVA